MNSTSSENQQRSAMIMSMEKTFNNAWFMRRESGKDQYCTLSSSQYWDFITYIDVCFFAFLVFCSLTISQCLLMLFVLSKYRMIIYRSGKSLK